MPQNLEDLREEDLLPDKYKGPNGGSGLAKGIWSEAMRKENEESCRGRPSALLGWGARRAPVALIGGRVLAGRAWTRRHPPPLICAHF